MTEEQHCTRGGDQNRPKRKKYKNAERLSEEALGTAEKRAKQKAQKGKNIPN